MAGKSKTKMAVQTSIVSFVTKERAATKESR